MAIDMFLKIDGIAGESVDAIYAGLIQISGFGLAMHNSINMDGSGSGAGKASMLDLSITKTLDIASTEMMKALLSGTHIKTVDLTARKSGGKKLDYYKIAFTNCVVSSYQMMPASDDDSTYEAWTIHFGTYKVTYLPQDAKGAGLAAISFGWDLATDAEIS